MLHILSVVHRLECCLYNGGNFGVRIFTFFPFACEFIPLSGLYLVTSYGHARHDTIIVFDTEI